MKVLVACEMSGRVRDAFLARGHDAWSCDLLPSLSVSDHHFVQDVRELKGKGWDLVIAHPPCTSLAVSGNGTYSQRPDIYLPAAEFAQSFMSYADKVCVENPVGRLSTIWRKPDQYVQPWMFGHGETKKTGLWLKGLPLLKPTKIVEGREQRILGMAPSVDRAILRSLTYQGIADAMAEQWG